MLILDSCVLVFILFTPPTACVNFRVASEALANGPQLATGAHLENNYFQRPPRWTKHHVAHARIERTLMAGALKASTRDIEVHRTSCMRTSPAVRHVFAVGRA
jgi:hypothetical protein